MAQRNWGAIIAGEESDLQAWSSVLKPPFDPWVEVHGNDTILRSSSLNDLPDSSEVRDRSLPYIDVLNGAFALAQSAKSVRFNGVVEIAANGLLHRHLFVELFNDAAYEIRGTAATVQVITYGPDGKPILPPPQPTIVQSWAATVEQDEWLEDALVYFGRSEDWFDIYKALECLIEKYGGQETFFALGWASKDDLVLLKRTANAARHAKRVFEPPEKPMDRKEAHFLLGGLIRRALQESAARLSPRI